MIKPLPLEKIVANSHSFKRHSMANANKIWEEKFCIRYRVEVKIWQWQTSLEGRWETKLLHTTEPAWKRENEFPARDRLNRIGEKPGE